MTIQRTGNLIDCMLFANRLFWRDLLSGNYTIFLLAVFVSITCVTSIQFLANRVEFSISKLLEESLWLSVATPVKNFLPFASERCRNIPFR